METALGFKIRHTGLKIARASATPVSALSITVYKTIFMPFMDTITSYEIDICR